MQSTAPPTKEEKSPLHNHLDLSEYMPKYKKPANHEQLLLAYLLHTDYFNPFVILNVPCSRFYRKTLLVILIIFLKMPSHRRAVVLSMTIKPKEGQAIPLSDINFKTTPTFNSWHP